MWKIFIAVMLTGIAISGVVLRHNQRLIHEHLHIIEEKLLSEQDSRDE